MANYTAADIKALRERTGAGMLDVKKALDEADGNVEKAVEIIRVKGLKGIAKREGRSASDGLVAIDVSPSAEGETGVLVEVNSETDFVAKSPVFIALADKVLAAAVASGATDVEALLAADVAGAPLRASVEEAAATIGEKIVVRRLARVSGEKVTSYLHRTNKDLPPQVGVLIATDAAGAEVAKDIAMHIAAYSPTYLSREDVPAADGRGRAAHRRGDRAQRGQAGGCAPEDRRGSPRRLLQGERPPRPGLRQGPEEVGRPGARRGQGHGYRLRPVPRRRLTRPGVGPDPSRGNGADAVRGPDGPHPQSRECSTNDAGRAP